MYTNIKTGPVLREISMFLYQHSHRFPAIPTQPLSEALGVVMRNNFFRFGYTYWKQLQGNAMGTPPGPSYANLYYAIHEKRINPKYPQLFYSKRYIDDSFVIWVPHDDPVEDDRLWAAYKQDLNTRIRFI